MLDSITSSPCQDPTPRPGDDRSTDATPDERSCRLAQDIVARFVLDPSAFARGSGAEPTAFVRTYRESLDRRLATLDPVRPAVRQGLATLGEPSTMLWPNGVPIPEEGGIRMGAMAAVAVMCVAVALVTVVTSIATAMAVSRHKPL